MKSGDLVIVPEEYDPLGRVEGLVGIIIDSHIVRNRIPVLWANKGGEVLYEPIKFLEVVNESLYEPIKFLEVVNESTDERFR